MRRAILSVYDKTGLTELGQGLHHLGGDPVGDAGAVGQQHADRDPVGAGDAGGDGGRQVIGEDVVEAEAAGLDLLQRRGDFFIKRRRPSR